jgi:hypothetical protein
MASLLVFPSAVNHLLLAVQDRRHGPVWAPGEFQSMAAHLVVGCAVAVVVFRLVPRVPWPRRIGWRFVAIHLVAAPIATAVWLLASWPLEQLVGGISDIGLGQRAQELLVIGSFFYVVIAGLSYSANGAARASQAEAVAAQTQLATLRSQLQPHFLFNALHTIVQLKRLNWWPSCCGVLWRKSAMKCRFEMSGASCRVISRLNKCVLANASC